MAETLEVTLTYTGNDADRNLLDLYDAGQALIGPQRSLALTTHLIINGEIITQAPSLKGARILSMSIEEGSWRAKALVVLGAIYEAGIATKDSPIGNVILSEYGYVIHETLGFHVDYNKPLGQLHEEYKRDHPDIKIPPEPRLHSLSEKCESFAEGHA